MPITDWPQAERPREKLLARGPEVLSDAELLAIFLRTGVAGKTAVDVARELLLQFGGLRPLLMSGRTALCATPGLGNAKYAQLMAALEIGRRHLGEALTIGRLCTVARVGERSLQLAFQARRGMSPMRFVCERRLAAANRRMVNADVGDDITGIAASLGFTHLGRFSMAYREAFGESPSQTLLRSRGTNFQRSTAQ